MIVTVCTEVTTTVGTLVTYSMLESVLEFDPKEKVLILDIEDHIKFHKELREKE